MLGFATLLALMLTLSLEAYHTVASLDDISDQGARTANQETMSLLLMEAAMKESSGTRGFLLTGEEQMLERDEEGKEQHRENIEKLRSLLLTEEGKQLLAEIESAHQGFRAVADKEIQLKRGGKGSEATELMSTQAAPAFNLLDKATDKLFEHLEQKKKALNQEQDREAAQGKTLAIALCLIGIAVGFVVAILISRSLIGGINRMVAMIQDLAANNLAVDDLEITSQDEIGQAGLALNKMKNNLAEIIQSIAGTAEHVASASEELSSSASLQAQGAETQNNQTTQVATAMQEMSSTVLQVSENSNKASDASRQAAETAREGGTIVEETLVKMRAIAQSVDDTAKKMQELGKSSDQIGRIAGVIDDIADQTNLLALNAAIEAARAGEQGRGFAVVADEVRKLAERTTTATKEIAQMIKNIQEETKTAVTAMESGTKQVEEGVTFTSKAGDSLKQIIQMSEQVGEMITHIATAATEQSSASEEINHNMEEIAKLVRESADGAQQSAKACQDLSGLALDLQKMVANFQLGNRGGEFRRAASSPAHRPSTPRTMAASAH
jgi:methyl-accepting chemotaxis protein